jgi:hypothetical protein
VGVAKNKRKKRNWKLKKRLKKSQMRRARERVSEPGRGGSG